MQAGVGIGSLADYIVPPDSNLVQIDLPLEAPQFDTYFVYPEELKETKRVTAFRDFIVVEGEGVEFLSRFGPHAEALCQGASTWSLAPFAAPHAAVQPRHVQRRLSRFNDRLNASLHAETAWLP